jgi:hypothetical protein
VVVSNEGNPTLNWSIVATNGTLGGTFLEQFAGATEGLPTSTIGAGATSTSTSNAYTGGRLLVLNGNTTLNELKVLRLRRSGNPNRRRCDAGHRGALLPDASGVPSGRPGIATDTQPLWTFSSAPGSAGLSFVGDDVILDLAAAGAVSPTLAAGRYWLSAAMSVPSTAERWFHLNATDGVTPLAQFVTPNASGPASGKLWRTANSAAGDSLFPGYAMKIDGTVTCGASWLSVNNSGSSLGLGGSATTTVTLNAGALTAGTYTAYLCVSSNGTSGSPENLLLPVNLTVTPSSSTPPSGVGSASPSSVPVTTQSRLTVAVTPGTSPASTGIAVTANLTSIGGSATQALVDNGTNGDLVAADGTYSFLATGPGRHHDRREEPGGVDNRRAGTHRQHEHRPHGDQGGDHALDRRSGRSDRVRPGRRRECDAARDRARQRHPWRDDLGDRDELDRLHHHPAGDVVQPELHRGRRADHQRDLQRRRELRQLRRDRHRPRGEQVRYHGHDQRSRRPHRVRPARAGERLGVGHRARRRHAGRRHHVTATNSSGCTITLPATSCNLSFTSVGAQTINASYGGDTKFNGSTAAGIGHTVNQAGTTVTISDPTDPTVFGQSVQVNGSVAVTAPGGGTPGGTITVTATNSSGCTITLPATSCNLSFTTVGAQTINASYGGDTNFSGSTASGIGHTVNKAATTVTISDPTDPTAFGQTVQVNGSVSVTAPGAGTPGGAISVTATNSSGCTITLPATSCNLTFTATGAQTINASYGGDANFANSTASAIGHQVDKPATTLSITDQSDPSVVGQSVQVDATLSVTPPGSGTPGGTITVTATNSSGCTITLPATSCSLTFTAAGAQTINASYGGDASFAGSTASAIGHQVDKAGTTLSIVDQSDPSVVGQSVQVDATLSVTAPGAGTPGGTIASRRRTRAAAPSRCPRPRATSRSPRRARRPSTRATAATRSSTARAPSPSRTT